MPQVNPTVTACGMKRMSEPSRERPTRVIITPDSMTVSSSPSRPNSATVAATSTMNAPAGPPHPPPPKKKRHPAPPPPPPPQPPRYPHSQRQRNDGDREGSQHISR